MKEDKTKVLFDSNIVIDILTERDNSADSIACFLEMAKGSFTGCLLSKQITDIYYVLRKYLNKEDRNNIVSQLLMLFEIIDTKKEDIEKSLLINGNDMEDNLLIAALDSNSIDYIITKNTEDFKSYSNKRILPKDVYNII